MVGKTHQVFFCVCVHDKILTGGRNGEGLQCVQTPLGNAFSLPLFLSVSLQTVHIPSGNSQISKKRKTVGHWQDLSSNTQKVITSDHISKMFQRIGMGQWRKKTNTACLKIVKESLISGKSGHWNLSQRPRWEHQCFSKEILYFCNSLYSICSFQDDQDYIITFVPVRVFQLLYQTLRFNALKMIYCSCHYSVVGRHGIFFLHSHTVIQDVSVQGVANSSVWAGHGVLACLGHQNRIPSSRWLVNNRHLFLRDPKAGSLRSGCQHGWILMRAQLFVHR